MQELTIKQKILSTVVTVNDGRLDQLSIGDLNRIVNYLLTKNLFDAYIQANELTRSSISVDDICYISDIVEEVLKVEVVGKDRF